MYYKLKKIKNVVYWKTRILKYEKWPQNHHFFVKAWLDSWLIKLQEIFLAPFYYHFGHYSWFQEFMLFGQDAGETIALFILAFFFIGSLVLLRNFLFSIFNKSAFKSTFSLLNRLSSISYNFFFFNLFKRIKSTFFVAFSWLKNKFK